MKQIGNNLYADEGKWLYQECEEQRYFYKSVTLATPECAVYFLECTNEEKEQWEREHPVPEPEETPTE